MRVVNVIRYDNKPFFKKKENNCILRDYYFPLKQFDFAQFYTTEFDGFSLKTWGKGMRGKEKINWNNHKINCELSMRTSTL